jgi:hypothetical protein
VVGIFTSIICTAANYSSAERAVSLGARCFSCRPSVTYKQYARKVRRVFESLALPGKISYASGARAAVRVESAKFG